MKTFALAFALICGMATPALAKPLSQQEQLNMYRYCRATYSDRNVYFAKKMCGCVVQAYMRDIPVGEATLTCNRYASYN